MTHPRLSVSEMCTYPLDFGTEVQLWRELEVQHVGVITAKLEEFGLADAVAALEKSNTTATTVITRSFDLAHPETWDVTRKHIREAVDLSTCIGGCVYFTSGRRDGRSFDELTAALAEAVAPCISYAKDNGVSLAIEPSLRTDVSYVHTLRDGFDVAEQVGINVIADLGNCWTERDYEKMVRRAGSRIAAVQFADALYGTSQAPSPGGRAVPGDGDLDIASFIRAALESGYEGPFELEMVGPKIEGEGYEAALRRGTERASELLDQVLG